MTSTPTDATSIVYPKRGRPGDATWLTGRDRAVLLAVGAGRGRITTDGFPSLLIDHRRCCDQSVSADLLAAGLIGPAPSRAKGPRGVDQPVGGTDPGVEALLTPAGRTALLDSAQAAPGDAAMAARISNRSIREDHGGDEIRESHD